MRSKYPFNYGYILAQEISKFQKKQLFLKGQVIQVINF